jgi:hypothetical protein
MLTVALDAEHTRQSEAGIARYARSLARELTAQGLATVIELGAGEVVPRGTIAKRLLTARQTLRTSPRGRCLPLSAATRSADPLFSAVCRHGPRSGSSPISGDDDSLEQTICAPHVPSRSVGSGPRHCTLSEYGRRSRDSWRRTARENPRRPEWSGQDFFRPAIGRITGRGTVRSFRWHSRAAKESRASHRRDGAIAFAREE